MLLSLILNGNKKICHNLSDNSGLDSVGSTYPTDDASMEAFLRPHVNAEDVLEYASGERALGRKERRLTESAGTNIGFRLSAGVVGLVTAMA